MTPEQGQLRDLTVSVLVGVPTEQRGVMSGWIEALYIKRLREGWPELSDAEVAENVANYTIAVGSRLMQIEISSGSGAVGHG